MKFAIEIRGGESNTLEENIVMVKQGLQPLETNLKPLLMGNSAVGRILDWRWKYFIPIGIKYYSHSMIFSALWNIIKNECILYILL